MRKIVGALVLVLLLCGCGAEETMETLADELEQPVMAQPKSICVQLPGEAALPAMESDNGRIYVCRDYEIVLQTVEAGDLNGTIQEISGRLPEDLTVVQTEQEGATRYDFVWASAGEGGDQLGQAVILDDGNYHYTMTVTRKADSTASSQVVWSQVFDSFSLG